MIFFLLHSTMRMADRCMIERDMHRETESTYSRSKLSVKENSLTLQKKERESHFVATVAVAVVVMVDV